jgi:hypothetical protein
MHKIKQSLSESRQRLLKFLSLNFENVKVEQRCSEVKRELHVFILGV